MADLFGRFLKAFERHTSPIDWCEPNYVVTPHVAEFFNTISNAVFVVMPLLPVYIFHPFRQPSRGHRSQTRKVTFIWVLTTVIGFASALFHATLSIAGQLMDEFGILWVFSACLAFYIPRNLLPAYLSDRESKRFETMVLIGTIILTVLGCFWPLVNSFVLMTFCLPGAVILFKEIQRCPDKLACSVAHKALLFWTAAMMVWLSDRFACDTWRQAGLPGGHWLWHVLVYISTYHAIVFIVYNDAQRNMADALPVMRVWPSDARKWTGIAYVQLRSPLPELDRNSNPIACNGKDR